MTPPSRHHWRGLGYGLPSFGLLGCYLLVGACASYSPHQSALPTAPGATESFVAADLLVVDRGLGAQLLALPEFGMNHGLTRHLTLGGRVYPLGFEGVAKHRLVDRGGSRLTVMPLVAVSQVTVTNADTSFVDVTSGAALLGGVDLSPELSLNLGLRSQLRLGLNAVAVREDFGEARWGLVSGGSLGLDWRLTPGLTLNPAVLVLAPYDLDRKLWDYPIVQGGAAIAW